MIRILGDIDDEGDTEIYGRGMEMVKQNLEFHHSNSYDVFLGILGTASHLQIILWN